MGYSNVLYYVGGMADWVENGGLVEKTPATAQAGSARREVQPLAAGRTSWANLLDKLADWSLQQLVGLWLGMILVFGLIYWAAGLGMGWGLQAGGNAVKPNLDGPVTAEESTTVFVQR